MQNFFVREFFKYLFFFFCFFVFCHAGIYGLVFPFAAGFALALLWCNQKILWVLGLYACSALIYDFSLATIVAVSVFAVVMILVCGVHKKLKKPITFGIFLAYGFLAQSGFLIYQILQGADAFFAALSVVAALVFFAICKTFFCALSGGALKIKGVENMCALLVLCALSLGLYNITIFGVAILMAFAPVVILLFATTKNVANAVLVASVMGLGSALLDGTSALLAPFVVWAIVASVAQGAPRVISAVALVAFDALMGFGIGFYANYSATWLVLVAVGAFAFCILPQNAIQKFGEWFAPSDDLGMRSVVNRSRENICKRLHNLSDAFSEMDWVFRQLIKGGMTKAQVTAFLVSEVKEKVCADCTERNICHRRCTEETSSIFQSLVLGALERGRATLLDAPPYLTTRCARVPMLVNTINGLCDQWKNYATAMNNIDASRILIADELRGMSLILKNLANEIKTNISFDASKENQIINELGFHNIACADVVLYQQNLSTVSATLVVKKFDAARSKIPEVVSRIAGCKLAVAEVTSSPRAGWDILTLKTAPKYNLAFGTACVAKDGSKVSGDAYSIIKLAHDKYLLALCDGMGSGEKAERASGLAISLVENFYKAGFDSEIILSSVNKLLALNNDDVFNALDICVLDTMNGTCDFIKMGAPESFIKHNETIEKIFGGTLPLGIMQDAQPAIIKQVMQNGDFVFMFTDGITDSFESTEVLQDFINNMVAVNPQTLAENLLNKAVELCGGARDDMTVIVAKVFRTH
ncbi:MAG: SpoIIE family protein phosphatase [Clostridia bacterium]|nr:SpoIIE family protein phosphatase [Clostridia bacterium]